MRLKRPSDFETGAYVEEEWTEVGDFLEPRTCRECGEMIEPVCFSESQKARKRYMRRGDHVCGFTDAQLAERKRQFRAEVEAQWAQPVRATIEDVRRRCHLPEKLLPGLAQLTVDDDNQQAVEAAWEMVRRFQSGERFGGLYLWGEVGVGKTATAAALAFDLANRTGIIKSSKPNGPVLHFGNTATVQFWDLPRFFEHLQSSWDNRPTEYTPERAEAMRKCECLVLDDLGKEHPSGHKRATLFRLINDAYNDGRALVLTSNYDLPTLAGRMVAHFGDDAETEVWALVNRLEELCQSIQLTGGSRRQRRAA